MNKNNAILCPHFRECSGCAINEQVQNPPLLTDVKTFFSSLGYADFKLRVGKVTEWRVRAKLVARGTSNAPLIGLYKEGSHDVVNIPFCKVHHPKINSAVELIKKMIADYRLSIYNETTGVGDLRYLQLTVDRATEQVQLALVLNGVEMKPLWKKALEFLWNEFPEAWHSIWINYNTRRDNVIFGDQWNLIFGDEWMWDRLGGAWACFHPGSFMQANPEQFNALLETLNTWVPVGSQVGEFYAGAGVIGLSLLNKALRVACFEINPVSEVCFNQSLKRLDGALKSQITWVLGKAKDSANVLSEFDTVVVDPPRKGVEQALLQAICDEKHIQRLIYISCGWEAFKRDAAFLIEQGFVIEKAEGFLFFPGTNQIEVLALFNKPIPA